MCVCEFYEESNITSWNSGHPSLPVGLSENQTTLWSCPVDLPHVTLFCWYLVLGAAYTPSHKPWPAPHGAVKYPRGAQLPSVTGGIYVKFCAETDVGFSEHI